VRKAVAAIGEALAIPREQIDEIKTAVSEACNNVVLHAYNGESGPLDVEIYITKSALEVTVRDYGAGIQPRMVLDGPPRGVGMALITALSDRVEVRSATRQGTNLSMWFATPQRKQLEAAIR
jgi:anti-sigma regulatory factor (Ser/Thr protein kinase)